MSRLILNQQIVAGLLAVFCGSTGSVSFAESPIDFNRQVRPILAEHCFQCHGPDATKRGADLRLDVEAEAKSSAIVAGVADDSELIRRIHATDPETVMPPASIGKPLSDVQKDVLRQWIQEGAEYSGHWAFQPITWSMQRLETSQQLDPG